jgi:hypothetical protein
MSAVAFDQFHPMRGDVCDGKRVLMADGTTAAIAAVTDGWIMVHEGAEYGPHRSAWQVLHELARIQQNTEGAASPQSHVDQAKEGIHAAA